jgi:hypothetical protein
MNSVYLISDETGDCLQKIEFHQERMEVVRVSHFGLGMGDEEPSEELDTESEDGSLFDGGHEIMAMGSADGRISLWTI